MRASFSSRDADNHTAFIRIKTNASNEDEFIILPVEVEVTTGQLESPFLIPSDQYYFSLTHVVCFFFPAPGIYSSTEMLDFGTLRSQGVLFFQDIWQQYGRFCGEKGNNSLCPFNFTDRPKQLNLHLLNSGAKDVSIMVIYRAYLHGLFVHYRSKVRGR